jgi:hypothetical protein
MSHPPRRAEPVPILFGLLLLGLLAWRYHHCVFAAAPLLDEGIYFAAGQALLAGRSPFDSQFLYLPAFAWLVGQLLDLLGEAPLLVLMRGANLAAVVFVALFAARHSGFGLAGSRLLAAALVLLAPAAEAAVCNGNTTFIGAALLLLALSLTPERPWQAGLWLGASLLAKPLAPGAVAWLAGCRSPRGAWGLYAAAVAGVFFVAGFYPFELLPIFLEQRPPTYTSDLNASFYRLAQLAGLAPSPLLWCAGICLLAMAIAARRPRDHDQLFYALPAALAAAPLVWNHTLCLTWPLQAAALGAAFRRRRGHPLELAAVAGGVLLLSLWKGSYALPSPATRFALTALVALAPAALAAYALRHLPAAGEPPPGARVILPENGGQ